MVDVLNEIIANKSKELVERKARVSISFLENSIATNSRATCSMKNSLVTSQSGIISEFKRKSPSKGWINRSADIGAVVKSYSANGAAAISVLTDTDYFGGSMKDLQMARNESKITPLLRKEFIVDEYQLYEASFGGADAVLLIAAAIDKSTCNALARKAHELGLEVLLEIHSESELEYISDDVDMVGVNNRNLGSFVTDVQLSFDIADKLPSNIVKVSESGITNPAVVRELRSAGYRGFLIGENFMKTSNPGLSLNEFIQAI